MPLLPRTPSPREVGSLAIIGLVVAAGAAAFAYTAGWLSPDRLTPTKLVGSLAPKDGPALGHRRNHAKGICFTGVFEANGDGVQLSRAGIFAAGKHPALGRFNLGTADPNAPDATVRVRGLGLQLTATDGAVWRAAMIDPPVFPVATAEGFYELQTAAHSADPQALPAFVARHPEFLAFAAWAKSAPWTGSYAETAFHSLNAFVFVDGAGGEHAVRWAFEPQAEVVPMTEAALAALGPDHLEEEIATRVAAAPQRWTLTVTVADPGDPTADATKVWPPGRRTVEVGTLVVDKIEAERDGPCRDINFDPTILPDGIRVSDDPLPAARSAAYAKSYDLRTAEAKDYPTHQQTTTGGEQ